MESLKVEGIYKKLCILSFAVICIVSSIAIFSSKPTVYGDGYEYILYTEAIENHFSFDIRQEDYAAAVLDYPVDTSTMKYVYENHIKYTESGKAYFNHFALYAALVMPIKMILEFCGLNQLRAFCITNALLYIFALGVIWAQLKARWSVRFYCLVLSAINPVLLYMLWPHTEVYIYAFTVLSLVFYYNKEYRRAALAISIASMQNLAIIPFGAIIGLTFLYELFLQWKREKSNTKLLHFYFERWRKIASIGLCYIPFFIPIMHTIINFHTYSLVVDVAKENEFMFEKAWAYLFDLNLGILPYEPVVLVIYIYILFKKIIKKDIYAMLNCLGIVGILYIISNQRQINCGMNGIMRYNVWIIPIIIFFVVNALLNNMAEKKIVVKFAFIVQVVYLGIMLAYLGIFPYIYGPNDFAPWTRIVLSNVPSMYNPTHGIFISRTVREERYELDEPCMYIDDKGYIRKVLVDDTTVDELDEYYFLCENIEQEQVAQMIERVREDEGYRYINFNKGTDVKMVPIVKKIDVRNNQQYNKMLGAYDIEEDHFWVMDNSIVVLSDDKIEQRGIEIQFIPAEMVKNYSGKDFELEIYINEEKIRTISEVTYDVAQKIYIYPDEFERNENGNYVIEFQANSFAEVSNDDRVLSFLIQYVGVME